MTVPGKALTQADPDAPRASAGRWAAAGTIAACLLCAGVILAYAALLPRASWAPDEYFLLAQTRDYGWAAHQQFFLHWSPRIFSNMIYAAYGYCVFLTHRPLSISCLALLWAGLGSACLLPALRRGEGSWPRALLGLGIFTAFLAGHDVAGVFFWPGGGISYLPTLAGCVWLFWCLADNSLATRSGRFSAAAALAITAGCSEVGIFAAMGVAGCIMLSQRRALRRLWWLMPGLAVALLDFGLLLFGRAGTIEGTPDPNGTLHRPVASLLAALPDFLKHLAAPGSEWPAPRFVALAAAAHIALVLAGRWSGLRRGALLPAFALGLLIASFATIASAYFQFGTLCCDRHDTMRACFATLAFLSLGIWSAGRFPPRAHLAPLAWTVVVLLVFVPRAPALLADIRSAPATVAVRAKNWQSGSADGPDMLFVNEPQGRLLPSYWFITGSFTSSADPPWWDRGLLRFFHKTRLTIKNP